MTTDERESMYIACCLTCLLSKRMKNCPNCLFNVGLPIKALYAIKASERVEYPENLRVARIKILKTQLQGVQNVNRT